MPAAYSLGGEERLEHAVANVGRDAVTGVADSDHHELPGLHLAVGGNRGFVERRVGGLDRELAAAAHGIARIDREIDDGRRKLRGIGQHAPGVGREHRLDLDVLAEHRLEQLGGLHHQAVDLDLARLQRLAAREGQKLRGDRRAARRRVVDQLGDRCKLRLVRQAVLQDLDRAGDDGQHVVEVVGDAAGELADRIHLLRLAQPLLGLVLLGQVGCRAAIAEETAVGGKYRPAVDADAAQPTGRVAAAVLETPERLVPLQRRQMLTPFLWLSILIRSLRRSGACRSAQPDPTRRRPAYPRYR